MTLTESVIKESVMKRVLVPLDGTENAEAALEALKELCDRDDRLILLSVQKPEAASRIGSTPGRIFRAGVGGPAGGVTGAAMPDLPVYLETEDQVEQRQVAEATTYLEKLAAPLQREGFEVVTEVLVDEEPDEAIIEYARREKPTFIAMLRHSHRGIGELIFGSIASNVTRSDVGPVLFVPFKGR
jgi:nucleotide-binding universal stress UspA family protein